MEISKYNRETGTSASLRLGCCNVQEEMTKAGQDIARLTKALESEHVARVSAEEKLEETEQTLTNLTQENTTLQTKLSEVEKVWGAKLEEAQNKLQASETELTAQKKMITQMLTAVMGKFSMCFFFVLTRLCSVGYTCGKT